MKTQVVHSTTNYVIEIRTLLTIVPKLFANETKQNKSLCDIVMYQLRKIWRKFQISKKFGNSFREPGFKLN